MSDVPTSIGPYRIAGKLGEGGMGAVYEAVHEAIERRVAIKVLHSEFAKNQEFIARFFNEARAVNRVSHPGLVQISDYGKLPDGTAYIVMEYLKGDSLAGRLKRSGGALAVADVLRLATLIADSLTAAHEKGIVHRDLKPENIMIVADPNVPGGERTKLLDFGIAKLSDGHDFVKTRTNSLMGTPMYMSPEQCRGARQVDDRSDVYSFGVLLYVMTSGQPLFDGEGLGDIMGKHMFIPPPPLESAAPEVPAALADLVARLLSKDKQQRPPMREVADTLRTMATQLPKLPRKPPRPKTHASTAGTSSPLTTVAGQTQSDRTRGLQRTALLAAFAGVVAVFAITVPLYLSRHKSIPAQPVAAAPVKPVEVAAPRTVHWNIDSDPAGSEVVRDADGAALCVTPCKHEQPFGTGRIRLRIRHKGYQDRILQLAENADAERNEVLDPAQRTVSAKPSETPATLRAKSPANRPPDKVKPVENIQAAPPVIPPPPHPQRLTNVRPKLED